MPPALESSSGNALKSVRVDSCRIVSAGNKGLGVFNQIFLTDQHFGSNRLLDLSTPP